MKVKELGHIVLYVSDLARSRRFYGETLGWREITPEEGIGFPAAAFSSGRTHHELLLIEVRSAPALPRGRRLGLYHFGLKIGGTDDGLREAGAELAAGAVGPSAFLGDVEGAGWIDGGLAAVSLAHADELDEGSVHSHVTIQARRSGCPVS